MIAGSPYCANCRTPLPMQIFNTGDVEACPSCGTSVRADAFPALLKQTEAGQSGENIVLEMDSGCFFHPQKKAVVSCALCGRFLCGLCDIEFGGRHVCATCLEAGKRKHKIVNLETQRILYDDIALSLAVIPVTTVIFFWLTVITAPASLFIAIRHWKTPSSVIARTKARLVAAIIFSSLQIGGWMFLLVKWLG